MRASPASSRSPPSTTPSAWASTPSPGRRCGATRPGCRSGSTSWCSTSWVARSRPPCTRSAATGSTSADPTTTTAPTRSSPPSAATCCARTRRRRPCRKGAAEPVRTLILGATGFLGSPIRRAVEEHPRVDEVVAVGLTPPTDGRPWRELDLAAADDAVLADLLAEYKPDAVINAAGRTTGTPEQLHGLNVAMVDRLLGAVHRVIPGARVVHVGSAAEYGPPRAGEPTRESDETHPVGPYGETKLAST